MKEAPKCILCSKSLINLKDSIHVLGNYICGSCEQSIINLNWDDPNYDYYKSGVKKIWRCKEA